MLKTYQGQRNLAKTFFDTAKDHGKNCFSANVRQCNIADGAVHVQFLKNFFS